MAEYLTKLTSQITDFVRNLSFGKKVGIGLTSLGIIAGLVMLFSWAGSTAYVPLMTNLNSEDAANIIRVLRDKKIPFEVDPTGRNVSIPRESTFDLRLELASMGLPQSSIVGYEVFDKQTLGTTSYVQRLNQKRALEGEITRTINTIKGVKRSRVHLAIPQKSAFVEDQKRASASVALDLEPGTILNDRQVFGIGNLVAKAVEGLEVPDVVIVDSNGKVLSKNNSDPLAAATATQLDFQSHIENELEKRIESMLSRVVGDGKVVARVTAELDFSQTNETQTIFDGDAAAVRSTDKRTDSAKGERPAPGGAAGAASNTPGQPDRGIAEIKTDTSRNNEVTNYEIPQTVRRTTKAAGTIKKLSVAVVVDAKQTKSRDDKGVVTSKSEPWTPEKLKEFETIIAGAAGIDKKRGDSLELKSMEFTQEDFDEASRLIADAERKQYIKNMITTGLVGFVIIAFFLFVVRPFIKWMTENTIDAVDTFLPQTIEELERMQKNASLPGLEETVPVLPEKIDPEKVEGDMLKEKIVTMVDTNPHKAALILKEWLESKTIGGLSAQDNKAREGAKPNKGGKEKTA